MTDEDAVDEWLASRADELPPRRGLPRPGQNLERKTVRMPVEHIEALAARVDAGEYTSVSAAIRAAVRELVEDE